MVFDDLTDAQLVARMNEVHNEARRLYALKSQYETELNSRSIPSDAEIIESYDEPSGGLTSKQISEIRRWAKTKHTTDELVTFISSLVSGKENK